MDLKQYFQNGKLVVTFDYPITSIDPVPLMLLNSTNNTKFLFKLQQRHVMALKQQGALKLYPNLYFDEDMPTPSKRSFKFGAFKCPPIPIIIPPPVGLEEMKGADCSDFNRIINQNLGQDRGALEIPVKHNLSPWYLTVNKVNPWKAKVAII